MSASLAKEWQRFTPAERIGRWLVWLAIVAATVWAVRTVEIIPEFLADAPEQMADLLIRMWPPDLAHYHPAVHAALIETLHIATLGTLFSFILAVPLGLLAARNICRNRAVNAFAQLLLVASRSVNSLVWALIFVAIFGPGATSSSSSKLIHGGLRYLEHYEFRLVREALAEREVLLRIAPHIVWPMRFVLPHRPEMRPRWLIRAGLFLYDHLARRVSLPGAESVDPRTHPYGAPLDAGIKAAFAYSDCWVEDSRLVVLNARDAADRGAEVLVRTAFVGADRAPQGWICRLRAEDGTERRVMARALVNAAGPWVLQARDAAHANGRDRVRLIRGSHIVLPALYEGDQAYILQNDDRRVVFVIPYEGRFSLVGTTDVPHEGDARDARCTAEEAAYLCAAVAKQFRRAPKPEDIVWTYSGVRPLHDDGADDPSAVTRDYVLKTDALPGEAPSLTIYGGKITTYRRLAEEAVGTIGAAIGHDAPPWTATAPLPGGDLGGMDLPRFEAELVRRHPWLAPANDVVAQLGGVDGLDAGEEAFLMVDQQHRRVLDAEAIAEGIEAGCGHGRVSGDRGSAGCVFPGIGALPQYAIAAACSSQALLRRTTPCGYRGAREGVEHHLAPRQAAFQHRMRRAQRRGRERA
ncbi:glycerol-3-phosphate dehydrogenase [Leptolyngbya sp. 15MV]|nr:glycerol-3-phosphate dehydrogenase [Leptolyngbya sp. 15MV]